MIEQAELKGGVGGGAMPQEVKTSHEEKAPTVKCVYCEDFMVRDHVPRFNRTFGIGLLVLGLVISAFMALVIGLPLVAIGAYMGSATRHVWVCPACAAMVDRDGN